MPAMRDSPLVPPFDGQLSIRAYAQERGVEPPISLRMLLGRVETKQFQAGISSAGLEALGGTVDLTIRSDGTFEIHVHMHDSGFVSYSFRVVVVLAAAGSPGALVQDEASDGAALLFECTGDVEGTDKTVPFSHEPRRDFDWQSSGVRQAIARHWQKFRNGEMHVSKAYEHGGLVGTVEDIAAELTTFLIGTAVLGIPPVALIALASSTFSRATGVRFLGPGGLVGFTAAAGTFYLFGPAMVFPVFVAGTVAGELILPRHRPLQDGEIEFARKVFGDTIPYDRVILSDLVGIGGRPFTLPGVDGSIIVNIGVRNAYDDPVNDADTDANACKNQPGQLFIHEMTHAWQIANGSLEGFLCDAAIETKVGEVTVGQTRMYSYGSADGEWGSDFNMEQQATLVEEWFGGTQCRGPQQPGGRTAMDAKDPYFRYIAGNIRLGLT
jgi:hypothetical protein